MNGYELLGGLLTVAAAFAYVNYRWIRLPPAIGMMVMSLGCSILLLALEKFGIWDASALSREALSHLSLDETLLHGMLGALLFAGALHIDLDDLRAHTSSITALALIGTTLSSFAVGGLAYVVFPYLGVHLPFVQCLLFGTLISPTDPIAVMGILKDARVPHALEIKIAGESLFNDGIGVVLFLTVLGVSLHGDASPSHVALLFAQEVVGGILFGLLSGYLCFWLLRSIDHYQTELLITLALVLGGYSLAERCHVSAPIAAVVSGLLIGNHGRTLAMSDVTRDHLDKFWSLVDEILNAVLFVLIGFEMLLLKLSYTLAAASFAAIAIVLFARWLSVTVPTLLLYKSAPSERGTIALLTWGGLRGGISVALALSLPHGEHREAIVVITYGVVVFSVLCQGLSLGAVARRFRGNTAQTVHASH